MNPTALFMLDFYRLRTVLGFLSAYPVPKKKSKLDTLCVSPQYMWLDELLKPYLAQLPSVKNHLVHLVYREEIDNLVSMYGLEHIGYVTSEDQTSSCGCGCGCH